jgi:hypothetical protein
MEEAAQKKKQMEDEIKQPRPEPEEPQMPLPGAEVVP